jgi:hypothetical protein
MYCWEGHQAPYDHAVVGLDDSALLERAREGDVDAFAEIVRRYEQRVRGVLLWNVWEQVEAARRLIAEEGPFDAAALKGLMRPEK